MLTKKQTLINFLREIADKYDGGFVGLVFKLPDHPKPELIVNLPENLHQKANYLLRSYNEDLTSITNPEVRIVRYGYEKDFELLGYLIEEEVN